MDAFGGNFPQVETIAEVCQGDHEHEPWGLVRQGSSKRVHATSLEKHYPVLLCEAIVHSFILRLSEIGLKFSAKISMQHASRAATAEQSKSLRLPPLISPYKSKLLLFFRDSHKFGLSNRLH